MVHQDDIHVYLIDLDTCVSEQVIKNADGGFSVYINARLSYEARLKSYNHAVKHIEEDDFQQYDVQDIEAKAHGLIKSNNIKPIPGNKYVEEIRRIQRRRKRLQRQLKEEEKRIRFMVEECGIDLFERAENYKLYGEDL